MFLERVSMIERARHITRRQRRQRGQRGYLENDFDLVIGGEDSSWLESTNSLL
jgi:hypothetical protein